MSGSWLVISGLDWIRGSGRVGGEGLERRQDGGLSGLGVKPCHLGRLELHLGKSLLDVVLLLDLFLWYFCLFFFFFVFGHLDNARFLSSGHLDCARFLSSGHLDYARFLSGHLDCSRFLSSGHLDCARFLSFGHLDTLDFSHLDISILAMLGFIFIH